MREHKKGCRDGVTGQGHIYICFYHEISRFLTDFFSSANLTVIFADNALKHRLSLHTDHLWTLFGCETAQLFPSTEVNKKMPKINP